VVEVVAKALPLLEVHENQFLDMAQVVVEREDIEKVSLILLQVAYLLLRLAFQ
tara:strand:+ start:101 stop:259 length:159 start_codon:yes stop_codon:yes gene_type:complete